MEYEEAAAYAGLLDRLAIDCEMPSADELLHLEVADHRLVFQRIILFDQYGFHLVTPVEFFTV